jgi:hypothetical protein
MVAPLSVRFAHSAHPAHFVHRASHHVQSIEKEAAAKTATLEIVEVGHVNEEEPRQMGVLPPRSHHPDHIASHSIFVVPHPLVEAKRAAALHYPQISRLLYIKIG